jgi:hypothetical protein
VPTVLTTSTQHADLKHCDSLAFFTTQHLRPSDHHTKALFQHARPDAGAGCCRGGLLQGRYAGCSRPFRAGLTLHTLFVHALHGQGRPHRARCCCCVLACHHVRAGALQPSIMGHPPVRTMAHDGRPVSPCGLTGRQAGPGQASAAQTVGARAWTGPSGPRGTVRRPASGVRAYATMRARCSNARGGGLALRCKWTDDRCSFALCQGRAVWSAACSDRPMVGIRTRSFAWLLFNSGAHVCWF